MALHKLSDRERSTGGIRAVDATGWQVRTRLDDESVGKVREVLVEDSGEARFLDVDLGLFSKRVLVPMARATADSAEEIVWVSGFDKDGFEHIPEYDGDLAKLNADYQEGLIRDYAAAETAGSSRAGDAAATRGGRTTRDTVGRNDTREEEAERIEETRGATPRGDSQLGRLGEMSDYEVADYHEDVRGWDVVAMDDRRIGKVEDLVVDTTAMKVRYLDVELDRDFRRSDEEARVLIPIGEARILKDPESVRVDSLGSGQAREIPTHRGTYSGEYETRVQQVFSGSTTHNPNVPRR